jgi:hypothetical protein
MSKWSWKQITETTWHESSTKRAAMRDAQARAVRGYPTMVAREIGSGEDTCMDVIAKYYE